MKESIFPGVRDGDFSYPIYKVRIPNRDQQRGLSGGYRLIYLKKDDYYVLLLLVYSKSDQDELKAKQIKRIEKDLDLLYKENNWDK